VRGPAQELASQVLDWGRQQREPRRTKLSGLLRRPFDRGGSRCYSVLSSPPPFHIRRPGNTSARSARIVSACAEEILRDVLRPPERHARGADNVVAPSGSAKPSRHAGGDTLFRGLCSAGDKAYRGRC